MKVDPWGEFCEIFGITPRNRIIEFFLACRELDYSIADVAELTELNRATTYNIMEELIKLKYVIPSRKLKSAQLYKLNMAKKEVKFLIKVFGMVLDNIAKDYEPKAKVYARFSPKTFK